MTQVRNFKKQPSTGIIEICTVCQQLINEDDEFREDLIKSYSSKPCYRCQEEVDEGNYIFVLISDKSEENKIRRLGVTWVVEKEEVEKLFDVEEEFNNEQIVFVRESEAIEMKLLDEKVSKEPEIIKEKG